MAQCHHLKCSLESCVTQQLLNRVQYRVVALGDRGGSSPVEPERSAEIAQKERCQHWTCIMAQCHHLKCLLQSCVAQQLLNRVQYRAVALGDRRL